MIDYNALPRFLILTAAMLLVTFSLLRMFPTLSWDSLSLGPRSFSARRIALGILIGGGTIGTVCGLLLLFGELEWVPSAPGSWARPALMGAAFFLVSAALEELTSRGYLFALVRHRWGRKAAVGVTSVIFGAAHLFNPGATLESILAVTLAGVFLGVLLLTLRSLYAVIAAHAAWNWTMSGVFHISVSGLAIPSPNYAVVDSGPDWLTGGHWGPEGGSAAIVAMLVAIVFMYRRHLRKVES